jgi:four helix bundle protein
MIKSFRDLRVYQRAYELTLRIHRLTLRFPNFERYELGRQMREASRSIPANIAEGYGRKKSSSDFKRFLQIALGSCDEMTVWLDLAKDLGYLKEEEYRGLKESYEEVGKGINRLIQVWKGSGDLSSF